MNISELMRPSSTNELSLDEVISRLKNQASVDAILLAGNTSKSAHKPYSDYDLLIVVNEVSSVPSLIITSIDAYLSELYFLGASAADEILADPQAIEANTLYGAFISMIIKGVIAYDASGRLAKLRTIASQSHYEDILDHQIYAARYSVTYNHAQNVRYFHSQDALYLDALQCRLLYCISNCLNAYFTLRKLPWRGEKEAIRYLRKHDSAFLDQFQETTKAGDIYQQFPQYVRLVEQTLPADMPLWSDSYAIIQPQQNITAELIHQQIDQWERWIKPGDSK